MCDFYGTPFRRGRGGVHEDEAYAPLLFLVSFCVKWRNLPYAEYHNDRRCLEHVQAFEASTAKQCQQLKRALLLQCRDRLIESVIKHLIALQQNERSIGLTLQEVRDWIIFIR